MGMVETARDWTVERWRELPADGNRYELVDGELLVTPSPGLPHQLASFQLARVIADYVERFRIGLTVIAPADVQYDDRTVVEPDIFVAPLRRGRRARSYSDLDGLLLAVEVISPSSARADRITKRRLYQRHRVPEYWIIDLDARVVERWRPDDDRPELLAEQIDWQPVTRHPPLSVNLPEYFRKLSQE